jgi:hypothetical protein
LNCHSRKALLLTTVLLALAASGCTWLTPPPPALPKHEVAAVLQDRATALEGLQADLRLRISHTIGNDTEAMPSLGGVLAFDALAPGMWMRAEKFTQEVFTLRALRDRFSLKLPRSREVVIGGPAAYARLPYLVRPHEVKGAFAGPDTLGITWPDTRMRVTPEHYCFEARVLGVIYRRIRVDRRELVVTDIERYDSLGRLHTAIRMHDYVPVGNSLAPRALVVQRKQVSYEPPVSVTVRLDLDNLEPLKEGATVMMRPRVPPGWPVVDLDREPVSNIRALELQ